jgi:hypothetical protein
VFQVVSRRYERGSIVLTSNRGFSDWGAVFADQVVAAAILTGSCTTPPSSTSRQELPDAPPCQRLGPKQGAAYALNGLCTFRDQPPAPFAITHSAD